MVPTSAHTGDGMGSLIAMIIEKCQTTLAKRLSYTDELQATVMEVSSFLDNSKKYFFINR
jgi:translation initiation factor 5B